MNSSEPKNCFKKILPFIAIWIIICTTGTYFRLYPLQNNISFEAKEKATILVLNNLRNTVKTKIKTSYPNLSETEQNRLIKKQFDALLHKEGDKARETINDVAKKFNKAAPGPKRPPYLLASDSYYYYGLTERIQQTGTISDTIKGSKYLNKMMLAPIGNWEPFNLHPYIGYYLYKIISFFNPGIELMYAVSFTPIIIMVLSLIPFLFICATLRCSLLASLTGAIYLVLAPIFLKRSMFGWYDNDPYNILFPFAILAVLFYGLGKGQNIKKTVLSGCATVFLISIYALFWQGWVFLETVIILAGIASILYNHFIIKQDSQSKNLLIYFGIITAGTFIGISLIFGISEFFILFKEGWIALKNFLKPQLSLWPDLYIAVGELRSASLPFIIDLIGGYIFFSIALLGLATHIFTTFRKPQTMEDNNPFPIFTLSIFLAFALIMTLGAQRFALLCLVPLSILFPLGIDCIYKSIKNNVNRVLPANKTLPKTLISTGIPVLLSLILIIPSVLTAQEKLPSLLNQIFNDTWDKALTGIKTQTPEDSIINTWWPPGHFVTSTAKRKVTFDGATINTPQAYWMANIFLSQDERQALGLLRMLNNSANQAAEYLQAAGMKLSETVKLLKEITPLNQWEAGEKLNSVLDSGQIDHVLSLTHKNPPPSYLMIYGDLVESNIQLTFVGKWDFKKIEKLNSDPDMRKKVPAAGSKEYVQFLWNVSGGRTKYSGVLSPLAQTDTEIIFGHNVKINLINMQCTINSKKFGKGIPQSIVYLKGDQVVEKKFTKANLPYSVLFYKQINNTYNSILLDTDLANSLILRLYFFDGAGLKYIQPVLEEADFTRRTHIYVYKIDWEGFLKDLKK